jgi:aspartate aminotransferase-like enzyme
MGDCNALMLLSAIGGAELAMHDAGIAVPYGAGVAAAQRWYHESSTHH